MAAARPSKQVLAHLAPPLAWNARRRMRTRMQAPPDKIWAHLISCSSASTCAAAGGNPWALLIYHEGLHDNQPPVGVAREHAAQGVEPLGGQALLLQRQAGDEPAAAAQLCRRGRAARAVELHRQRTGREGPRQLLGRHAA